MVLKDNKTLIFFLIILIIIRFFLFFYNFNSPVFDQHSFRQTQNLMAIRNYFREGINLFFTRYDMFGKPGYVILEFPLYQAGAAAVCRFAGQYSELPGRMISIFSTIVAAIFLFLIVRKFLNRLLSILSAMFFLCAPNLIYYSRAIMIEPLITAFSLIMGYFYLEWTDKRSLLYWLAAVLFACLAFMTKPMYAFVVLAPVIYYQFEKKGSKKVFEFDFVLGIALPLLSMLAWFSWGSYVNSLFQSTFAITKNSLLNWYLGSIGQRLNPIYYIHIAARSGVYILGLSGIFLFAFAFKKWRSIPKFLYVWLLSSILYIVLFLNMNYIHDYYQFPLIPILAIFQAIGADNIIESIKLTKFRKNTITIIALSLIISLNILISMNRFLPKDYSQYKAAKIIEEYVPKRSNVIVISDVKGPQIHYHSDTKGHITALTGLNIIPLKAQILREKIEYLVIIGTVSDEMERELRKFELLHKEPIKMINEKGKHILKGSELYIYKI